MKRAPLSNHILERTFIIKKNRRGSVIEITNESMIYSSAKEKMRIIKLVCVNSASLYSDSLRKQGRLLDSLPNPCKRVLRLTKLGEWVLTMIKIRGSYGRSGFTINPYAKIFDQVVNDMNLLESDQIPRINTNSIVLLKDVLDEFSGRARELYESDRFKKDCSSFYRTAQKNRDSIKSYIHQLLRKHSEAIFFSQIKISNKKAFKNLNHQNLQDIKNLESARKIAIKKAREEMKSDFLGYIWKIDLGFDEPDSIRIFLFFKKSRFFYQFKRFFEHEINVCQSALATCFLKNYLEVSRGQFTYENENLYMTPETIADHLIAPDFLIRFTLDKHRLLGKGQIGPDPRSKK